MNKNAGIVVWIILLAIFAIVAITYFGQQSIECDKVHGVLVKGVFGYECIEQGKH